MIFVRAVRVQQVEPIGSVAVLILTVQGEGGSEYPVAAIKINKITQTIWV